MYGFTLGTVRLCNDKFELANQNYNNLLLFNFYHSQPKEWARLMKETDDGDGETLLFVICYCFVITFPQENWTSVSSRS